MNILFNFSTLKAGGGQNVALNFLHCFREKRYYERYESCYYVVASGSKIDSYLSTFVDGERIYRVSSNPLKRLVDEFFGARQFIRQYRIDIIYSYFGYGMFPCRVPQIAGSAVSNIYFPEINFWEGFSGFGLWKRKLVDRYRRWTVMRSAGVVFETELLEHRCRKLFRPKGLLTTIRPSIFVPQHAKDFIFPKEVELQKKGLFLCGWQRNKQIMLIPEIAACLKKRAVPFLFVLTAPKDDSPFHHEFLAKVKENDVHEYIYLPGTIEKAMLASLYRQIDFVFLLSKLESFSNNIIEAWTFGKPLIASDEEWTHAICGDSAIYVERSSPEEIASQITSCLNDEKRITQVVEAGKKILSEYPTIEERTEQELSFIEKVYAQSH